MKRPTRLGAGATHQLPDPGGDLVGGPIGVPGPHACRRDFAGFNPERMGELYFLVSRHRTESGGLADQGVVRWRVRARTNSWHRWNLVPGPPRGGGSRPGGLDPERDRPLVRIDSDVILDLGSSSG